MQIFEELKSILCVWYLGGKLYKVRLVIPFGRQIFMSPPII